MLPLYAKTLLEKLTTLKNQVEKIDIVFSDNAMEIWKYELGTDPEQTIPFKIYSKNDFFASFASGSAGYDTMIICPCSMGTLGRIANGTSDDLITRASDVILKERNCAFISFKKWTCYNARIASLCPLKKQ